MLEIKTVEERGVLGKGALKDCPGGRPWGSGVEMLQDLRLSIFLAGNLCGRSTFAVVIVLQASRNNEVCR